TIPTICRGWRAMSKRALRLQEDIAGQTDIPFVGRSRSSGTTSRSALSRAGTWCSCTVIASCRGCGNKRRRSAEIGLPWERHQAGPLGAPLRMELPAQGVSGRLEVDNQKARPTRLKPELAATR